MALRRFCSDMMWFNRFCGVESNGFARAAADDAEVDLWWLGPAVLDELDDVSDTAL